MRWPWQRESRDEGLASPTPGSVRRHYLFGGTVQAVGFRFHCDAAASEAGLTGWVKNLDDGCVACELQGMPDQIERFFANLDEAQKTAWFRYVIVACDDLEPVAEQDFRIRY